MSLERETLHVMDDKQRVAIVETRTQGSDGSPPQLIRYQFSNHLGSSTLELDEQAAVISYEEYYPYGSTSYQAVRTQTETPKRYRSTGKERDEETGLYYHGARYYAPWLGRWAAADPLDLVDGVNLCAYGRSNPVIYRDRTGMQTEGCAVCLPKGTIKVENEVKLVGKDGKLHTVSKTTEYILPEAKKEGEKSNTPGGFDDETEEEIQQIASQIAKKDVAKLMQQTEQRMGPAEKYELSKLGIGFGFLGVAAGIEAGPPVLAAVGQALAKVPKPVWVGLGALQTAMAKDDRDPNLFFGILGMVGALGMATKGVATATRSAIATRAARVTSAEVAEALAEAAKESATTTIYHGGVLEGGEVQAGRTFSTTTDLEYAQRYAESRGGQVYRFDVPTARLNELKQMGGVQLLQDSLQGTSANAPEWRFGARYLGEGGGAKELMKYYVPGPK